MDFAGVVGGGLVVLALMFLWFGGVFICVDLLRDCQG